MKSESVRCPTCSKENKFVSFILFLQFKFSFKSKSYIEDIPPFIDLSHLCVLPPCTENDYIIHTLTYELNGVTMKEDEETRTMNM